MANALKCDRCGSYFDYSPALKNFIAFGHKDIIIGKNFPVKDICPDCITSFMYWFENPGNYDPQDLVKNLNEEYQKALESIKAYADDDKRVNNLYKEAEEIPNNAGDTKEEEK